MSTLSTQPLAGDSQLIFDRMISFAGGQMSVARANLLQDNQFSDGENMDIDAYGNATTRRGTAKLGTPPTTSQIMGAAYFDTPSLERIVEASGSGIYDYDNASWSGLIAGYSPSATDLQVEFAQMGDYLYFVDGVGAVHRYNGTTIQNSSLWGVGTAPPAGAKYIIEHQNRIAISGNLIGATYPDQTIYFSDILSGNFPTLNAVTVMGGDGDPIKGMLSWQDYNLLCFKERSLWLVDTSLGVGSSAVLKKLHDTLGTISNQSICQTGQDVLFLAKDGVRSVQQTIQDGSNQVGLPLSYPINDFIQRINWTYAHLSCGIFWNNRYLISVPLDSSTVPNYTLVYHTVNKSWSGYWTGWTPMVYIISAFRGETRLNFGNSVGKILQWRDFVKISSETDSDYQDDGTDIASSLTTRAFIFGDYTNPKICDFCEFEFFDSDATVEICALVDGETTCNVLDNSVLTYNANVGFTLPITLPFTIGGNTVFRTTHDLMSLGELREVQLQVSATAGKISLRAITASAYMRGITLRS